MQQALMRHHLHHSLIDAIIRRDTASLKPLLRDPHFTRQKLDVTVPDGYTALQYAALVNSEEIITLLVERRATLDKLNDTGSAAIHVAALAGNYEAMNRLIKLKADVNLLNKENESAVFLAVKKGSMSCVQLLKEKIDINQSPGLLLTAIVEGHLGVADVLIRAGINLHAEEKQTGQTALHKAAIGGYTELAEQLIQLRVDPNITDRQGQTALHKASLKGHIGLVDKLITLRAGLDLMDEQDQTALHKAVFVKNEKLTAQLIQKRADIHIADKDGNTPLHIAAMTGHQLTMQYLIDEKAELSRENSQGETAQSFLDDSTKAELQYKFESIDDVINEFRRSFDLGAALAAIKTFGGDINSLHSKNGRSLLVASVQKQDSELVKRVLLQKARVDSTEYRMPLAEAIAIEVSTPESVKIVSLLLENKADPSAPFPQVHDPENALLEQFADDNPLTLLIAHGSGNFEPILDVLLKAGADINKPSVGGVPPLTRACELDDRLAQVEALLKRGANPAAMRNCLPEYRALKGEWTIKWENKARRKTLAVGLHPRAGKWSIFTQLQKKTGWDVQALSIALKLAGSPVHPHTLTAAPISSRKKKRPEDESTANEGESSKKLKF